MTTPSQPPHDVSPQGAAGKGRPSAHIHLDESNELEQFANMAQHDLEQLALEALVVRLYALERIGSGQGAALLGISRRAFLDLLGAYGVSYFDPTQDPARESRIG